eukprot:UN1037
MPSSFGFGDKAIVRAKVPGVPEQATPLDGVFEGMEKGLIKEAVKQGAVFPDVNIDRAMYFLVSKEGPADQTVSLDLQDASGNPISDQPLTVDISEALDAEDLGFSGPFAFQTSQGEVNASMRIEVWGLTRDL